MTKFILLIATITVAFLIIFALNKKSSQVDRSSISNILQNTDDNPMGIDFMRKENYPGSNIVIDKTLPDGTNYHQYLTSYQSEGLKIYALLTVPMEPKPIGGFPVILFNHGYIAPQTYKTYPTQGQYATYYPVFSRSGYIVFKPDYRGNGNSDGNPTSAYYSPDYVIDDLNALASIKKYKDVNPAKIGVWGHSMGGNITFKDLIIDPTDIKAAVIWNGVVGSYDDLVNNWQSKVRFMPDAQDLRLRNLNRQIFIDKYGNPNQNGIFWKEIDPTFFLKDVNAPVQIDTTPTDEEVPSAFSQNLYDKLHSLGKDVEINVYPNDNHNLSKNFNKVAQDSLRFFDKYLK